VWTTLALETSDANLQHFNSAIDEAVSAEWPIPANWNLRAQMVIGSIEAPAGDKEYMEDSARF
ncbi:nitroreductase family protein, partial [Enterococcus faecalis]